MTTRRPEPSLAVPSAGTALLLIDVINDLAFKGSEALIRQAEPMAVRLAALKRRALLRELRTRRVIVSGIAGNICVLFTANDAYMRGLRILPPADCIVSNTTDDNNTALRQIRVALKGNLTASERLAFTPPQPWAARIASCKRPGYGTHSKSRQLVVLARVRRSGALRQAR